MSVLNPYPYYYGHIYILFTSKYFISPRKITKHAIVSSLVVFSPTPMGRASHE